MRLWKIIIAAAVFAAITFAAAQTETGRAILFLLITGGVGS